MICLLFIVRKGGKWIVGYYYTSGIWHFQRNNSGCRGKEWEIWYLWADCSVSNHKLGALLNLFQYQFYWKHNGAWAKQTRKNSNLCISVCRLWWAENLSLVFVNIETNAILDIYVSVIPKCKLDINIDVCHDSKITVAFLRFTIHILLF